MNDWENAFERIKSDQAIKLSFNGLKSLETKNESPKKPFQKVISFNALKLFIYDVSTPSSYLKNGYWKKIKNMKKINEENKLKWFLKNTIATSPSSFLYKLHRNYNLKPLFDQVFFSNQV